MPALRDLQGHDTIKQSLNNALALGRIAHAYLFYGPPGVGKKTAGYALAQALLCRTGGPDSCGHCDDCLDWERGGHPDLHVIQPQGSSIKIAQLRAVQNDASYTSYSGGKQVFLVEQAEKMTTQAANCILKILEEPPAGIVFILIADDAGGLLPTILSRCQRYQFNTLSQREVCQVLEACWPGDLSQAKVAARISQGSPGRALALLEGADKRDQAWDLLAGLVQERPFSALLPLAGPVGPVGREELETFINGALLFFRDTLVWLVTGQPSLLINVDYQKDIQWLAEHYSKQEILDILVTLQRASQQVASNVNQRLVLDNLLLKIAGFGCVS